MTVGEDGFARRYDVETGKMLLEEQIHTAEITDMQVSCTVMPLHCVQRTLWASDLLPWLYHPHMFACDGLSLEF